MAVDARRREQLLDDLTRRIKQSGMIAPAILFLETYKPLAFLGAQLLWFAQPFLTLGFSETDLRDLALIVEERTGIEELIARLEAIPTDQT
ncbi:MAG: hypothetical protein L0Y55_00550 [Anaerolineales bacterium]|nr:hypothetical protein [Anaerolineales bacterium]